MIYKLVYKNDKNKAVIFRITAFLQQFYEM